MITEPDVTFTDYGLAIECALLTVLLFRQGDSQDDSKPSFRRWFLLFFGSLGLAALTGGTVHGFFLDEDSLGYTILWPATLIALGITAWASWAIGAELRFSPPAARRVALCAGLTFFGYVILILFFSQTFMVAVVYYLPAVLFLLVVFALEYRRSKARPVGIGLAGLALTLAAAGVQRGGIGLHPRYFNHNALYHLIQAVALFMIFRSARWFVDQNNPGGGPR